MANQRQLRNIARNLAFKALLLMDFDVSDSLSEEDKEKLQEHVDQVALSITKKCYRTSKWDSAEIVKDVLKNVK